MCAAKLLRASVSSTTVNCDALLHSSGTHIYCITQTSFTTPDICGPHNMHPKWHGKVRAPRARAVAVYDINSFLFAPELLLFGVSVASYTYHCAVVVCMRRKSILFSVRNYYYKSTFARALAGIYIYIYMWCGLSSCRIYVRSQSSTPRAGALWCMAEGKRTNFPTAIGCQSELRWAPTYM